MWTRFLYAIVPQLLYVQVYVDRLVLKAPGKSTSPTTVIPKEPFSTERLLVGNLKSAAEALKEGIHKVFPEKWILLRPRIVLQAMERIDGGISEAELLGMSNMAERAGAVEVFIPNLNSRGLSDEEVMMIVKAAHNFGWSGRARV